MGGVWQCAVYGFGGVRVVGDELAPRLQDAWHRLAFHLVWQGQALWIDVSREKAQVTNRGSQPVSLVLNGEKVVLSAGETGIR